MTEYAYRVYESIVQATSSELILFFVILAVIAIPLYITVLKGRKAERMHEREREQQFIEVIKENSAVIAGLKATLDNSGDATKTALTEIASKANKILLIVSGMSGRGDNPK